MRVAREGGSGSVSTSVSPHGSPLRLQRPICVISTLRVHQRRFIMALSACKRAMAPFISPWLLAPRRLYLVPNITRYYSKSSHKYHHQTRMGKLLRQASFNTLLSRIFHQSSRSFHLSISCVHRCTNRVTLHAVAAFPAMPPSGAVRTCPLHKKSWHECGCFFVPHQQKAHAACTKCRRWIKIDANFAADNRIPHNHTLHRCQVCLWRSAVLGAVLG